MSPYSESVNGVLITTGSYLGTLAAIRDFGRNGVKVILADTSMSLSHFSRYLHRYESCPSPSNSSAFIAWLLNYGKRHPGLFLYPSCDLTAWLYSVHRDELRQVFKIYSPDKGVLFEILNKKRLMQHCETLNIDCPKSVFPTSLEDVKRYARDIKMPCLIKPQTQVGSKTKSKGTKVYEIDSLIDSYQTQRVKNQYEGYIKDYANDIDWPIIQEYHDEATRDTLSIAGFIGRDPGQFYCRASKKVMQTPRKIGVGLCFESTEPPEQIVRQCEDLCRHLGYYGIFEIEFICREGQYLLIDFNPRYYGQMEFEIQRSLSLPMILLDQINLEPSEIPRQTATAISTKQEGSFHYSVNWLFYMTLICSWLGFNLSTTELKEWFRWKNKAPNYHDAVYRSDDIKPFIFHLIASLAKYLRHPRATFRNLFLETN
ncbi:MAG: hypothetical protein HRU19_02440 [Pseudobacteriovorax sp.]|nr:hypothetical protein [Pseudobacteriovorax sp.]